jgi:nucleoside-diphosphate-sugar epimerase
MDKVILVTSPFGLGEKLILELLKSGESVYTVFPSPKEVPMSFLGKINLKYGFIRFDLDSAFEKSLPKRVKCVYHNYEMYYGPFTAVFRANTCATLQLFDWSKKAGVEKFIYISSGEVYGEGSQLKEKSPYNPKSFYATSKFESEMLFRYYAKSFSIDTLRVFFPFGRSHRQAYLCNLYQAVTSGEAIDTEYGVISPTYVDDMVLPLLALREKKENQLINFAGDPIKVSELIEKMISVSGKNPKKIRTGNIELTGDSSKATQALNYSITPLYKAVEDLFA